MEIRGKMTPKMYKRGQLAGVHFDEKGNFVSVERDKILNKVRIFFFLLFLVVSSLFPSHSCSLPVVQWCFETFAIGLPRSASIFMATLFGAFSAGRWAGWH